MSWKSRDLFFLFIWTAFIAIDQDEAWAAVEENSLNN